MSLKMVKKYESIIKSQSGILYIEGRPGEGKTAIAESIAKKNGWNFIDIRLAQVDSAEVIGIPVRNEKNGHIVHSYALPEWAVMANEQPTLVFFDELNRAVLETRNAALQILNERKIGWNFKFNDDVYFMSAGNLGEEDGTEVEELDSALRNRLVMMKHTLEFSDWKDWATESGINKQVVAFLESNLSAIHDDDGAQNDKAYASYRSWTNFAMYLDANNVTDSHSVMEYSAEVGASYVGKNIRKFIRYVQDTMSVSIDDVINRFSKIESNLDPKNQSRMYELLNELKEYDLLEFGTRQMNNVVKFCSLIHEDKLTAYAVDQFEKILAKGDKHFEFITDENGNPQARFKDIDNLKTLMKEFPAVLKAVKQVQTGAGEKEQYDENND